MPERVNERPRSGVPARRSRRLRIALPRASTRRLSAGSCASSAITSAAEDLTVETFWRISRAHARFRFRAPLRAVGAPHRHPRGARLAPRTTSPEFGTHAQELADLPAAPAADPGIAAEIRLKTAQAFARLPPRLRIAAVLAVVEQQPHKEVAAALGISVAAVKLRVFRALRLLRKDLESRESRHEYT